MPKIHVVDVEGDRWNPRSEDEHLWWPRVLWIDPGVVSGVATVWFDPVALFDNQPIGRVVLAWSEQFLSGPEIGLNGQVARFLRIRKVLGSEVGLATGCESFVIRQFNQDKDFLSPVRIRAGIEQGLSVTRPLGAAVVGDGIPLFTQAPNDAMSAFNNDRLRTLQMYTPGPDHVNDAKRHCLLWVRKLRVAGREFFSAAHGTEELWWSSAA